MTERAGQGARWPAVSRQRVNPATGRDRAAGQSPLGLTFKYKAARPMPPTMRRTCAYVLCWAFPYKRQRIRELVLAIFVASPRGVQKRAFLGGA